MTPKDKAKKLYDKIHFELPSYYDEGQQEHQSAKECALIAVDEIIDAIDWHEFETPNKQINYWLDVRKEIEKL